MDKGHWESSFTPDPDRSYGFIYCITNLQSGRQYIGKKTYWSTTRKKQAGSTRRKKVVKPSNWKVYSGSSKDLTKDIEELGKDAFSFEILFECTTKGWWTYAEINLQHKLDVLTERLADGTPAYYNKCIGAVKFVPTLEFSEEHRKKLSEAHAKRWTPERREEVSERFKGYQHTDEAKQKISDAGSKEWVVTTPEGEEIEVTNLNKFCLENGLRMEHLSRTSTGERSHHKGYTCRRV